MNQCTSCGAILEPGDRFCTNCGAEVRGKSAAISQTGEVKHSGKSDYSTEKLRIDVIGSTITGLFTVGISWAFKLKKWAELHLKYYEDKFTNPDDEHSSEIINTVRRSTNITAALSIITIFLLSTALLVLITSFFWEVVFEAGRFPFPEGPFWFFCWVSLSMLAVTWASVLLGISKVLKLRSSNWFPVGGLPGIIITTIIWCVLALGLLPLLIFPPIASGSVNKYVSILPD